MLTEFVRCILLCNSCVLSEGKLCSDNPDEVALLYGVRELGSVIVQKSDETVVLRVNGGEAEEWKLLRVNAFSSERKCMSVVAKNEKHGVIRVYVKVCVVEWTDVQGAEECVLAECDEKEQILYADIDLDRVAEVRRSLPTFLHLRRDVYTVTE